MKQSFLIIATVMVLLLTGVSHASTSLDDPNTVLTVMQFTLKSGASRDELQKRMMTIRDFIRQQPGLIDNALMENRNHDAAPTFVGVSRWKSFKSWEAMWSSREFKDLVTKVSEVGEMNPGTFAPIGKKAMNVR